jgi:hypothetical protein
MPGGRGSNLRRGGTHRIERKEQCEKEREREKHENKETRKSIFLLYFSHIIVKLL